MNDLCEIFPGAGHIVRCVCVYVCLLVFVYAGKRYRAVEKKEVEESMIGVQVYAIMQMYYHVDIF